MATYCTTMGAVHRNVPHAIASVPCLASLASIEMVNFSTGGSTLSDCHRHRAQILGPAVFRSPLPGLPVHDEVDATDVRYGPQGVRPRRQRQSRERDRRRGGELGRGIRSRAPDTVIADHVAQQRAPARQGTTVVHREGGGADGGACGIAHAELLEARCVVPRPRDDPRSTRRRAGSSSARRRPCRCSASPSRSASARCCRPSHRRSPTTSRAAAPPCPRHAGCTKPRCRVKLGPTSRSG